MDVGRARAWESGGLALALLEWLQALLSSWSARVASWKSDGDEEEEASAADPQVVAALEIIASLLEDRSDAESGAGGAHRP